MKVSRHLAISDIHGCFEALEELVAFIDIRNEDIVITLGDYVDRGGQSRAVIDWLIAFDRSNNLVPLRGNHDVMMCRARDDPATLERWLHYGGDKALASYVPGGIPGLEGSLENVPDEHWSFMCDRLLPYYEIDTHFFVHANADPRLPLGQQSDQMLYWEKFDDPPIHQSGKVMVCGHTSQRSGLPIGNRHSICLDSRVYDTGWLTCLYVETGEIYQANADGRRRTMRISELGRRI